MKCRKIKVQDVVYLLSLHRCSQKAISNAISSFSAIEEYFEEKPFAEIVDKREAEYLFFEINVLRSEMTFVNFYTYLLDFVEIKKNRKKLLKKMRIPPTMHFAMKKTRPRSKSV